MTLLEAIGPLDSSDYTIIGIGVCFIITTFVLYFKFKDNIEKLDKFL